MGPPTFALCVLRSTKRIVPAQLLQVATATGKLAPSQ